MARLRLILTLTIVVTAACGDDDASTTAGSSGVGGGTTGATTGTGGSGGATGGAGGIETDPYAACDDYCTAWLACADLYATEAACMADCEDQIATSSLAGPACFSSYRAMIECIGSLECAELVQWADPGSSCEPAVAQVQADCES